MSARAYTAPNLSTHFNILSLFHTQYFNLKRGTMLFHALRVVYTVKELDSHAKHGQSFIKQFGLNSISEPKILLPGSYKFQRVFFQSWLLMT